MALVLGTNSYTTVPIADLYFADNLRFASWDALSTDVKSRALVTASSRISLVVKDECKLPLEIGEITANLASAAAELGLDMVLTPAVQVQANTGNNIKLVKAGSAEVEFFRPTLGSKFPPVVTELLVAGDCLASATGVISGSYSSGTSGPNSTSIAADIDRYGLTEGYP
ncbi:MAG: hypothetical protein K0U41_02300 [Gammaproteobacteria bacterium]|nr:hypothetical protein [Gammaproteobacteria bacterium]